MNAAEATVRRAWMTVALLWFVGCLNYLDRVMITTMRGSIVDAIPMRDAQFGLLTTTFLLVYGVLSPFVGFLADRLGRSRVIVVSLVVWSLITWHTAQATTYGQPLATRAPMGISEACHLLRDAKINVNGIFQFGAAVVVVCAVLWFMVLPRRATIPAFSR